MHEHLIFFDSECPLCHRAVRHILEIDHKKQFLFAPLKGETADDILIGPQQDLRKANSLILAEFFRSTERQFWTRAQALFRIYWLTGELWALPGLLSFLPRLLTDPFYTRISSHRHQFKLKIKDKPIPEGRLLP